jgi:tRNA 2-selenouridine synthase
VRYQNQIEVEDLIIRTGEYSIIDVRTASEYGKGSVLGSINIPLFNEEERARIGLVYQKSPKAARFLALDLASPKLPQFIRKIYSHSQEKVPVAVCWRGGMRSRATVELLDLAGIEALQLRGGYHRYRQHIYQALCNYQLQSQILVLKGKSGTGKTEILNLLARQGRPVLDLEDLAAHRGSAFGVYPQEHPATQKNFEAKLLRELQRLEGSSWLLVEGESKRIGNIYLPDFLFAAMQTAPAVEVEGVERIVRDYAPANHEGRLMMYRALSKLRHKLPKATFAELKQCLDNEDYSRFVDLALSKYYDRTYDHQLQDNEVLARVNSNCIQSAAAEIATLLDNYCEKR